MIALTNTVIKRLILEQIVEMIDTGGIDELLQAGFSAEFLDLVRHRPARDLIKLAEFPHLDIRIRINEHTITSFLHQLDQMRRDAVLREYFVVHGASVRLICDLFKVTAEEARALRAQLLPPEALSGRERMLPDDVRDAIYRRWREITTTLPVVTPRERLYQLHQSFPQLRIDTLCRLLNEFESESAWLVSDLGGLH